MPVERYRFRVRGPNGRELISGLAELVLPPALARPRWSNAELVSGEVATLRVCAPGRDGESLLFLLERLRGGAWEPVTHRSARVEGGECQVEVPMPVVPAEACSAAAERHRVRFRAVAPDRAEVISDEATLLAAPAPPGRLVFAGFGHARYREGAEVSLRVEAEGLEGVELGLLLERSDGDRFAPAGEARVRVAQGVARARLQLARGPARKSEGPKARLRFRASCSHGELTSEEVELEPSPPERLLHPTWGGASPGSGTTFTHGQTALMRVQAPGLDGRRVRFVVEQLVQGRWETFAVATATVRAGVACAELRPTARTSPPGEPGKPAAEGPGHHLPLRFRPELLPAGGG